MTNDETASQRSHRVNLWNLSRCLLADEILNKYVKCTFGIWINDLVNYWENMYLKGSRSWGTILILSITFRVIRNCLLIGKIQTKKVTIIATTCPLLFKVALKNSTRVVDNGSENFDYLPKKEWVKIDLHPHLYCFMMCKMELIGTW